MKTQYHLKGKGFSGRAVRVRVLDPDEVSENLLAAAKLVGPQASIIELKKVEWRNGIKRMIQEISDPCVDPMSPDMKWKKNTAGMLDDMGAIFTSKDVLALEAIYRDYHEVIPDEVEAIAGKAVPVSED